MSEPLNEDAIEATRLRMFAAGMIFGHLLTLAGLALFFLVRWLLSL